MAEWSIAHPWKGCIRLRVSGVRIPLSPQKRTSSEVRAEHVRAAGAEEAEEARKARRIATQWLGGVQAKWAVLSRTVGFVPTFLT